MDFELANIQAWEDQFPSAKIHGCLFHFSQAVLRKLRKLGLYALYQDKNDATLKNYVKTILGLPFLHECLMHDAWHAILDDVRPDIGPFNDQLKEFLAYFTDTWICNRENYNIDMWNCYKEYEDRTNNVAEAFHFKLNHNRASHPNIFVFIDILKELQVETERLLDSDYNIDNESPKTKATNKTIEESYDEYENLQIDMMTFLKKCGFATTIDSLH